MDIMGQIFEIRCCIEILLNNNKMYTIIDQYMLYSQKVYILGELHPLSVGWVRYA